MKKRHLRSFEHVAHTTHNCDNCYVQIFPGDRYFGNVWGYGNGNGKLFIEKFHCGCPVDPDYDREQRKYEPVVAQQRSAA